MSRILRRGLGALAASAAAAALAGAPQPKAAGVPPRAPPEAPPAQFETPAPPFELGLFPCTQCHTAVTSPKFDFEEFKKSGVHTVAAATGGTK